MQYAAPAYEYVPAAQVAQLVPDTYWPAVHVVGFTVQLALPAALVVPAAQSVQSVAASCFV